MIKTNMLEEFAHLRDTFLIAEKDYILKLMKIPEWCRIVREVNETTDCDMLFEQAKKLVDGVENGMFTDEEMPSVETRLTILLAAIQDRVLEKAPKRKLMDNEEKGLSR